MANQRIKNKWAKQRGEFQPRDLKVEPTYEDRFHKVLAEKAALQRQVEALQKEKLVDELERAKGALQSQKKYSDSLETQVDNLSERVVFAEDSNRMLREENEEQARKLYELERENNILEDEVVRLSNKVQNLEWSNESLINEINRSNMIIGTQIAREEEAERVAGFN